MKILHYINNLGSGGAEKILTDILPLMIEQSHDVSLVICNDKANVKHFENILINANVKLIKFQTSFYNPFQIFKLIKFINSNKFDIVHAHLFPSQYWLAFASFFLNKKTKLIKTEHSTYNRRRSKALYSIVEKIVYNRYHKIICITQEVENNLKNWLGLKDKIITINNGVNLAQISLEKNKKIVDINFSNTINLLMVARFDFAAKDHITLVNSMQLLPNNYKLFFAGEGPNKHNVEQYVFEKELQKKIVFLGMRNDVYALMNNVDLNVLATRYEGLSGVTLESLASGKPFIGADVSGVNNVVPNSDFLFPAQNAEALSKKILEITSNKEKTEKMIDTALKFVKNYDTSIMIKQYLEVYNETVNIS